MGTLVITFFFAVGSAFARNPRVMCSLRFSCGFCVRGKIAVDLLMFSDLCVAPVRHLRFLAVVFFGMLGSTVDTCGIHMLGV